ncbi:MAG: amidohydrolase [Deltaproteobacteria bacterium]|nr:amidohydrolase [Deltaproteobacteria bacterium]
MNQADFIVKGGPLWTGPSGDLYPRGYLAALGGEIIFAGAAEEEAAPPARPDAVVLDAAGGLIAPGLVNAHCHGAMTLFRGLADDLPLGKWLDEHIFPAEAAWVTPEMTELATLLAAAEMLLGGVTTVCDSYFCVDGTARAYLRAGQRAVVAQGIIDFPAPGLPDPSRALPAARDFVGRWQEVSPLLCPALFAHSTYTCSARTLTGVAALAQELDVPWHIHLAETQEEVALSLNRHSVTPVGQLEKLGLLESLAAAVHCVWLEPGEMELLARRGVTVIACPESNAKLGSGISDLAALLAAGAQVALGTDGPASNNDLSMFGEMATASRLAKTLHHDPAVLPAATVLETALTGGAAALGLDGLVGALAPGYRADLMVLDGASPRLTPLFDPASALVYAAVAGDVRHVAVDGRLVVQDRRVRTFDVPAVMAEMNALARRVSAEK